MSDIENILKAENAYLKMVNGLLKDIVSALPKCHKCGRIATHEDEGEGYCDEHLVLGRYATYRVFPYADELREFARKLSEVENARR